MKREKVFLSVIVVLIVVSTCPSQPKKGDFLAGTFMNYGYAAFPGTGGANFYNVSFSPSIVYFFTDRFAAGLTTPFSFSKTTGLSFVYLTIHSYTLGPTMRYYFPVTRRWLLFPQVDYALGWQTVDRISDITSDNGTFKSSSTLLSVGFGSMYFITKTIGLEGIISLQQIDSKSASNGPSVNFALGLQVYLARRL